MWIYGSCPFWGYARTVLNWVGAWGLVPHASSHTTVQAVPHTAVPCFDTSEGVRLVVFGYQQPNIAFAYPLIPSYFQQTASVKEQLTHRLIITINYPNAARFGPSL